MCDVADKSRFILPLDTGLCMLDCCKAFEGLTETEKLYSHFIAQASWYGSLICLYQTSPESPGIFVLIRRIFGAESPEQVRQSAKQLGLTEPETQAFFIYIAGFLANLGNYKSFGDTKFIPDLEKAKFLEVVRSSEAYKADPEGMTALCDGVLDAMYDLSTRQQNLGLADQGITSYFSSNCTERDADIAQQFLDSKKMSAYNTRLFKYEENGVTVYEVRQASSVTSDSGSGDASMLGTHQFTPPGQSQPITFKVTRGDYAALMAALADNLNRAKEHAANDHERNMLVEYCTSFQEGSITAHKNGSRHWIRNKGPIVETYIGFIESYRDPSRVRGEFEGFVAVVNKEMSAKFGRLVEMAEDFLPLLPWPSAYEKDRFLRPDFTSLDILAFGSSGVPAGINIPNYDDIRQVEGFKNVSLGNVLSSGYKDVKITFMDEKDKELYAKLKAPSFEVQVGLHELLGHGSGKLFMKNEDGTFNFDTENVKHTETQAKISSFYEAGETWNGKFKSLSNSYEECRAECVGIYLCLSSKILEIFGHHGSEADDIIYVNWLNMVRAGLLALEFYNPDQRAWGQAHMHARYVILRVLLEAGHDLVRIEKLVGEDGHPDLILRLDRSKINSVGKTAIGDFLRKLQVYKSTGDYASAKVMFDQYSAVYDVEEPHFISLRDIVLHRKQPRKMFIQHNTVSEGDGVILKQYDTTPDGMIQSFTERFAHDAQLDGQLMGLWEKDKVFFT